jgi:RNA polymerase-binding transcription factor DksA
LAFLSPDRAQRGLRSSDVLTPEQTKHFRERLEAEKAELEAAIAALDAELKRPVREEEGVSDVGDEAANVFDREEAIAQIEVNRDILGQIERALQRLDEGAYGISEVSGQPIPWSGWRSCPGPPPWSTRSSPSKRRFPATWRLRPTADVCRGARRACP